MPREFGRNERVGQFISKELATLIQREFPINQYGMITVTNVDLSPDLKNATVLITVLNNKQSIDELITSLNENAGHFRHELSQALTSRGVPVIRFKYDASIERAQKLNDIINSVSQEKKTD